MTAPTTTVLDALVSDLRAARTTLILARTAFEHSPNGERQAQLVESQARVDGLLDTYQDATR